jgi:Ca2+/H+ antiporter
VGGTGRGGRGGEMTQTVYAHMNKKIYILYIYIYILYIYTHTHTHAHTILATQEAEIRRIEVQSQTRQIVHETLF